MLAAAIHPPAGPLPTPLPPSQEEGDLDYAAVALLAVACSLLECLVGKDGLMNDYIPSFALRDGLQVGACLLGLKTCLTATELATQTHAAAAPPCLVPAAAPQRSQRQRRRTLLL